MILDIRPVLPKDRFDELMANYDSLPVGDVLDVTFDHEPRCFMYVLDAMRGKGTHRFTMQQLDEDTWRAEVQKLA